jgi:WD40 repeat protein
MTALTRHHTPLVLLFVLAAASRGVADEPSPLITLPGHQGPVFALAFTKDGRTLASAGGVEARPGAAKLWDVATGKERANLAGHRLGVRDLAFSPDAKLLATGAERTHQRGHGPGLHKGRQDAGHRQ